MTFSHDPAPMFCAIVLHCLSKNALNLCQSKEIVFLPHVENLPGVNDLASSVVQGPVSSNRFRRTNFVNLI